MVKSPKKCSTTRRQRYADLVTGKPLASLQLAEKDFVEWLDEDVRVEWQDGSVRLMPPVTIVHDQFTGFFLSVLGFATDERENRGIVASSRRYVRLSSPRSWLRPDVKFISHRRRSINTTYAIDGPPEMIIEVVSEDSVARDYREKYWIYEQAGVREYWIVNPMADVVEAHRLKRGRYVHIELDDRNFLRSSVVPKFAVRPEWVKNDNPPRLTEVLNELSIVC